MTRLSCGRVAPTRRYLPELLADVLDGSINLARVFACAIDIGGVSDAYVAMDERRAVEALIRAGS